jgi:hypothetical protein
MMIYLAPDLGPVDAAPNGPNLAAAQMIGSVLDDNLSTTGTPSLITVVIDPTIASTIQAATYDNEFWVVIDFNGSNGVWYTNNGVPSGVGTAGQAHYIDAVSPNVAADGPFLMSLYATQ